MAQAQRRAGEHCLWSTYDQPKLNLAGLAAQRVTICGSCWAPRVPRLQVSRSTTEPLVLSYVTDMCKRPRKDRVFKADIRQNLG